MDKFDNNGKEASISLINENILVNLKPKHKDGSKRHRYVICSFILCVTILISMLLCFVCFAKQARPIRCGIYDKISIYSLECSEPATLGMKYHTIFIFCYIRNDFRI